MNEPGHERTRNGTAVPVAHVLEATTGGTRRHLLDLVLNLDRSRYAPSVICSTLRDPEFAADVRALEADGVPVTVVPMVREIRPWRDLPAFLAIRRELQRRRFTLVHTHSAKAGFLGRLAARLVRTPAVVHTPHGFPFLMRTDRLHRFAYLELEKLAARWTTRFICVSRQEAREAVTRGIAPADRVTCIPNGIVLPEDAAGERLSREMLRQKLGLNPQAPVVGSIGRLSRQKGYRHFVDAARQVVNRVPSARFVIIGDGECREGLQRQITRLSLDGVVLLVGSREDARAFYRAFDVFVASSLWEGLPYTLLDAMAAGTPVVASRVGGVPDLVETDRTGLLVPPADSDTLARAIVALLEDAALRRELAERARARVQAAHSLDSMVRATEAVYEACLAQAGQLP